MNEPERKKVTKAAGIVGAATLLSRITGFLRDMVIAHLFGASAAADAFFVAYRIPNLLRRLFAEGALTIAFIPIFTETFMRQGLAEARQLAKATSGLLCLSLLIICGLGMIFSTEVLMLIAPGFTQDEAVFGLAVTLTRWCFPYIFFISLAALCSGVLNSQEHFFTPALSPVLLNLCMIGAALSLDLTPSVMSLAVGVLVGGSAQLAIQLPYLKAKGISIWPSFKFHNPALKRILKLMLPAAFGAAIYQITVLVNTIMASFLPSGSISYLYYADRLVEFPLGIFAVALSTAVLPSLSRQAVAGNYQALIETFHYGLRLTMFICLPAMVGLILLGGPIISIFFGRGEFGATEISATTLALWGYGVGLWAFAGLRAVLPAFYALKDTKTPVKVGAACLVINIACGLILMQILQHTGLALATSISSIANFGALLWLLKLKLGPLGLRAVLKSLMGIALASLAMAGVLLLSLFLLQTRFAWHQGSSLASAFILVGLVALGMLSYLLAARIFKVAELSELRQIIQRRRKR